MLFEAIGQTFAVLGIAIAKCALGLFLLRIVTRLCHKAVIWSTILLLMAVSVSVCVVFWLQCTPPAYFWNRQIAGGLCKVDSMPVSMLLCGKHLRTLQRNLLYANELTCPSVLCIFVDFFFALMPWLFIWGLQMNRRDKLVILISMSFGVM